MANTVAAHPPTRAPSTTASLPPNKRSGLGPPSLIWSARPPWSFGKLGIHGHVRLVACTGVVFAWKPDTTLVIAIDELEKALVRLSYAIDMMRRIHENQRAVQPAGEAST